MKRIVRAIERERRKKSWSKVQLAKHVGISYRQLMYVYAGGPMGPKTAQAFAPLLAVDWTKLYEPGRPVPFKLRKCKEKAE